MCWCSGLARTLTRITPRAQAAWTSLTSATTAYAITQPRLAITTLGSRLQPLGCTDTSDATAYRARPAGSQARPGRQRAPSLARRQPGQASPPPQQLAPCLSLASPPPPSAATQLPGWSAISNHSHPSGRSLWRLLLVQEAHTRAHTREYSLHCHRHRHRKEHSN